MAGKHTYQELQQWQALPLSIKILMTKERIRNWIREYGEDGVYVSFSGGKDSTVLLDLVRQDYPNVKAVYVDTGLEFPGVRNFVKTIDNVEWLKPKINFKQVIEKYGYPFISKEVASCIDSARKYFKILNERTNECQHHVDACLDLGNMPVRVKILLGKYKGNIPEGSRSRYNYERYKFFLNAPFNVSHNCCNVMKKRPAHLYSKKTGQKAILGTMAIESKLRTQKWLENGCNGFDLKNPISTPIAFWTEQDILQYILDNDLPIAKDYGDIVVDYEKSGFIEGQTSLVDYGLTDNEKPILKTTGCDRTGCMFCGFGCHLEKGVGRFERIKQNYPKIYEYIMKPTEQGGLNYKEVIDWINENGNFNIKY